MHFPEARGITRFSYVCFPKTLTVLTCVTQEKGFHLLLTHVSEARTPGDPAKVCQSPALCGSPTRDLWVTVRDHLFYFRRGVLWGNQAPGRFGKSIALGATCEVSL